MASAFTHAVAALALGTAFRPAGPPARFWIVGAACATLPDLDAIGYRLGVPYDSALGHRGITHSLLFAAIIAASALVFFRHERGYARRQLWLYLFIATASHGLLDAMTSGGLGVAFFAPLDNTRHFFPWRPIEVSPLSIQRFFSARGLTVLASELLWVWLPAALFAGGATIVRRVRRRIVPGF